MLREDYQSLKTADGFYVHRCPDHDVVYSNMDKNTMGYLRKVIHLGTFESAQKLLEDYFLVKENLISFNIKDNTLKAKKMMLVITESEKCRDEIRELMKPIHRRCENASSIRMANRIYWDALELAKEIAYAKINPTVKPQVVYRVNWWYNLLK